MSSEADSTRSSDSVDGVEEYLVRLESRLRALPEEERREILEETRSHVADRYGELPEREAAARVVAELGPPDQYADAFLESFGVAGEGTRAQARWVALAAAVVLAVFAVVLFLFGVLQAFTPPAAEPVWFIWRDVGLGDYGWIALAIAGWFLSAMAGLGAVILFRQARDRRR